MKQVFYDNKKVMFNLIDRENLCYCLAGYGFKYIAKTFSLHFLLLFVFSPLNAWLLSQQSGENIFDEWS
jgi:hypothetical protein